MGRLHSSRTLRLGGDGVRREDVVGHDQNLCNALESCVDGPLGDHSWRQATLGPTEGGLGFRMAGAPGLRRQPCGRLAVGR